LAEAVDQLMRRPLHLLVRVNDDSPQLIVIEARRQRGAQFFPALY
jgi:hypothetical protein